MKSWNHYRPFLWPVVWLFLVLWGPWAIGVSYLWMEKGEPWPLSAGLEGWLYFAGAPANGPFAVLIWTGRLSFIEDHAFLMSLFEGIHWLMGGNAGWGPDENLSPFPILVSLAIMVAGAYLGQRGRTWLAFVLIFVGASQTWAAVEAVKLLT